MAKLSLDMCPENYQSYGRSGFFFSSTGFMFLPFHPMKKSFNLQKKTKMPYDYAVLTSCKLLLLRGRQQVSFGFAGHLALKLFNSPFAE